MSPDLARLGREVRARRELLRLTQRDAAVAAEISDTTWFQVEQGKKVSNRTLARVERALGWGVGSIDSILEGGEPTALPAERSLEQRFADLEAEVRLLREQLAAERGRAER